MKKIILLFLILSMSLTTACWDMIELEDRILPYSVAIDLDKNKDQDKTFYICFAYPNINALGSDAFQENLANLISSNANSIFDATKQVSSRIHNPIFLKHLNVLVMSEDVFSNEQYLREIFDGLQRDFIVNKMINILITEESSHELLLKKFDSQTQETIEGILIDLLRNEQNSSKFTPIVLMEFIQDMDHKKVAVVPLAMAEEEIIISGGGLFKDYKFLGYIDGLENRDISILNNDIEAGDLDIDYNGVNLSLSISELKSKKRLIKDEEVLKIQYNLEMDGQLHQYILDESMKIDSVDDVEDIENHIENYFQEQISSTIDKLQHELNGDALGILEYLYKFHPKIYKELEPNWDNIFPHVDIDVNIKFNIRRRGLSDY